MMGYTFDYSQEFKDLIVELHRGKEILPFYNRYIDDHLGGPNSRLSNFVRYLYPEIQHHCGEFSSQRVLDFGCGTGATTAVLAMHCSQVVAFDIDQRSITVCEKRLREHHLIDKVLLLWAADFEDVIQNVGSFDFILLNGVIEHIPLSKIGLRKKILQNLFDILNSKGVLYINKTPNRLWPIDRHTTQLWWIPWTGPGSMWAYSKAVKMGKHFDNPETHSDGSLGLEERGAWGATFFEIKQYLSGKSFEIINSLPGHDRHLSYTQREKFQRRIFDFFVYYFLTRWTGIPVTAVAPFITHLAIRKI
ncbi:MAG: class I SAM-dependent methyltransferase, partial [Deltaproteobacteria bacterium]|nr:class I SAM-dependent methyltransferase [Deltaproteobacteria bacterium]